MYASPIWSKAMAVPSYSRSVHSIYRLSALPVSCAFRTVSDEAALVIAGMVPLSELATEAVVCYRAHDGSNTGNSIRTEARMQSLLSGHGCFRSYLKRFGHDNTDECSWCGRGTIEDANHVIFECGRFAANRQELEDIMGKTITVDSLVTSMIETAQKWDAASTFAAESQLPNCVSLQKVALKLCAPETKCDEAQTTPSLARRAEPNVLKTRPTKLGGQKEASTPKRPRDGVPEQRRTPSNKAKRQGQNPAKQAVLTHQKTAPAISN
ncbi:uncharacterized protein [Drosophila virilis]|uniref:uncharacterized protein n=1 Tax=Drosophila virilis TaxID=7244 RepID=UPI0038B2DBFA